MGDTAVGDPTEGEAKPAVIHQLAESPLGGRTEGQDRGAGRRLCPTESSHCLVKGKLIAAACREWTDEVSGFARGVSAIHTSFLFMVET